MRVYDDGLAVFPELAALGVSARGTDGNPCENAGTAALVVALRGVMIGRKGHPIIVQCAPAPVNEQVKRGNLRVNSYVQSHSACCHCLWFRTMNRPSFELGNDRTEEPG